MLSRGLRTLGAASAILILQASAAGTFQEVQSVQSDKDKSDKYQFKVSVDLISLNVTVTDTRNRLVTDLLQKEFSVYEDGVRQEISVYSREDLPLRLILLLDTSASMEEKLPFAQQAAVNFVDTLKEDDVCEVVEFGSKARVIQKFTPDHAELSKAIRSTQAGGTTSLYNALYISLKDLARRREDIRRQAVILLSDGEDTSSLVTFEQVMELAKATDLIIYTISLRRDGIHRDKNFSEAEHVLKKFAEETGGQWYFPSQLEELSEVYGHIAAELKNQYNLGYISTNTKRDGTWRRVVVQADRSNLLVRTKLGYFAPRTTDATNR